MSNRLPSRNAARRPGAHVSGRTCHLLTKRDAPTASGGLGAKDKDSRVGTNLENEMPETEGADRMGMHRTIRRRYLHWVSMEFMSDMWYSRRRGR